MASLLICYVVMGVHQQKPCLCNLFEGVAAAAALFAKSDNENKRQKHQNVNFYFTHSQFLKFLMSVTRKWEDFRCPLNRSRPMINRVGKPIRVLVGVGVQRQLLPGQSFSFSIVQH